MPLSPRAHGAAAKAMFRSSCRLAITALAKRLARHISDIARAVNAAMRHDALDGAGGLVVIAALLVGDDDAEARGSRPHPAAAGARAGAPIVSAFRDWPRAGGRQPPLARRRCPVLAWPAPVGSDGAARILTSAPLHYRTSSLGLSLA